MKIKLIYGSDTGNTEEISLILKKNINFADVEVLEVSKLEKNSWDSHDIIILGIPTWYDGELQSDWEDYFEEFQKINFKNKTVAIFGLGDQIGYGEWFCDGIGILGKVVAKNGGKIVGFTKRDDSYDFESSKALFDEDTFWGLCLDEDNQPHDTEKRIESWIKQLKIELNEKNTQ